MKRHAIAAICNSVNPLTFIQISDQSCDALIEIIEIAINLSRNKRRASARAPSSSCDIYNCHNTSALCSITLCYAFILINYIRLFDLNIVLLFWSLICIKEFLLTYAAPICPRPRRRRPANTRQPSWTLFPNLGGHFNVNKVVTVDSSVIILLIDPRDIRASLSFSR